MIHIISLYKQYKEKNNSKTQLLFFLLALVYIGLNILYGASITFKDLFPISEFMIYKESTFMFNMILNFGVIETIGVIELVKNRSETFYAVSLGFESLPECQLKTK